MDINLLSFESSSPLLVTFTAQELFSSAKNFVGPAAATSISCEDFAAADIVALLSEAAAEAEAEVADA